MGRLEPSHSRLIAASSVGQGTPLIQVSWDSSPNLDEFQRFISAYVRTRFSNSVAERIALASNELLDNAVRYGSLAREFSYLLSLESSRISVCVHNSTVLSRIEMLSAQLQRLQTGAEQVYAAELERSTSSTGRRSMLGLARIRHEAEMPIELLLDGQDVTVRAYCPR